MIANPLTQLADRFFGRGRYGVTVPSMDGAMRPNGALDLARPLVSDEGADNVVACGDALFYTTRNTIWRLEPGRQPQVVHRLPEPATALASSAGGQLAVALTSGAILLLFADGRQSHLAVAAGAQLRCLTALAFVGEDQLVLANGSSTRSPSQWQMDLMEQGSSGSLWKLDIVSGRIERLASALAFPGGLLVDGENVVVAEAWKHRLLRIPLRGGSLSSVTADLPGYPGRMARDTDGAPWLCLFAPRSQLVEFVLREHKYRQEMVRTIPPEYWIAPAYRSGHSFEEPLQGGGVKQMGILKPWAPTRSYGLVVKLNANLQPVASFHSRSDGRRHGITSVAPFGRGMVVSSRGGGALFLLNGVDSAGEEHAATH